MRYLISYDLAQPEPKYDLITERLEELDAKRILQSVWVLEDDDSKNRENELRQDLRDHLLSSRDKLLVVTLAAGTRVRVFGKL